MRALALAFVAAVSTLAGSAALADGKPVVIELFTSQGCSSCPPADAMFQELAQRDDVLALALHVDYWDYIGWADNFARPENTQRQKGYARMAGEGTIYTPQIVVGGVDHVVGYKPMLVADLLAEHRAEAASVALDAVAENGTLTIAAAPEGGAPLPDDLYVDLVRYQPQATVQITHGENAGETITYANIVTGWDHLAVWDGTSPLSLTATVTGDDPLAVIVQERGPGRVLAAVRVR